MLKDSQTHWTWWMEALAMDVASSLCARGIRNCPLRDVQSSVFPSDSPSREVMIIRAMDYATRLSASCFSSPPEDFLRLDDQSVSLQLISIKDTSEKKSESQRNLLKCTIRVDCSKLYINPYTIEKMICSQT